jgi:hypothetical protein
MGWFDGQPHEWSGSRASLWMQALVSWCRANPRKNWPAGKLEEVFIITERVGKATHSSEC